MAREGKLLQGPSGRPAVKIEVLNGWQSRLFIVYWVMRLSRRGSTVYGIMSRCVLLGNVDCGISRIVNGNLSFSLSSPFFLLGSALLLSRDYFFVCPLRCWGKEFPLPI
ncbi:hypothetical protein CHUAL_010311 [Chamberlinius hualienensis]